MTTSNHLHGNEMRQTRSKGDNSRRLKGKKERRKQTRNKKSGAIPRNTSPEDGLYVYRPLATSESIRILKLKPGTGDDGLEGELVHMYLREDTHDPNSNAEAPKPPYQPLSEEVSTSFDPVDTYNAFANPQELRSARDSALHANETRLWVPYEALSYVWGSDECLCRLATPEGTIAITANLSTALYRLRMPYSARYIWADALCINQEDFQERSQQVKLMGRIYREAEGVLLWLGLDVQKQAYRLELLLYEYDHSRGYKPHPDLSSMVDTLLDVPWFSRVWVMQEYLLARKSVFLWGSCKINPAILRRYLRFTGVQDHWLEPKTGAWRNLKPPDNDRKQIMDMLQTVRTLRCSNDLDRIYALLRVNYEPSPLADAIVSLEPDYSLPIEELLTKVARLCITLGDHARVLNMVSHNSVNNGLPSWVPDLRRPSQSKPFEHLRNNFYQGMESPLRFLNYGQPQGTIRIKGIRLDCVETTMVSLLDYSAPESTLNALTAFWRIADVTTAPRTAQSEITYPDKNLQLAYLLSTRDLASLSRFSMLDFAARCFSETMSRDQLRWYMQDEPEVEEMFESLYASVRDHCSSFKSKHSSLRAPRDGRRLFSTRLNCLGIGPPVIHEGDVLVLSQGFNPFPVLLRKDGKFWNLVGTVYVPSLYSFVNPDISEARSVNKIWIERHDEVETFVLK